ncbi:hypothetical protein E2C01_021191 [Portunus trituberculatus]|uniref:Uncharacterized protein n=1 Tax=Portunus trituberculatus TaxID=210409 RepID=A0A5B7E3K0_PORTR|nr:hypothetical protein [Portunus trituberculatus]
MATCRSQHLPIGRVHAVLHHPSKPSLPCPGKHLESKSDEPHLDYVGPIKTIYAVDPEDTILSADGAFFVHPAVEHLGD